MRLAWQNHADDATIVASSEETDLPASNVQQVHLSRKWHTLTGVSSASLTLDMGRSVTCAQLGLLGTNLTSDATVRVRASDSDPAALASLDLDTGVVSAAVDDDYRTVLKSLTETEARYWRIDIDDTGLPDNIQIGRLFLGPVWEVDEGLLYDWGITAQDPSRVMESRGGQSFADTLPQRRVLQFVLDFQSEASMYSNAFALARTNGRVKDVLAIPFPEGAYVSAQAVWGLVVASEPLVHRAAQLYRQRFQIKERL